MVPGELVLGPTLSTPLKWDHCRWRFHPAGLCHSSDSLHEVDGRLQQIFPGSWSRHSQPHRGGSHCQWLFTQMMADFLHLPRSLLFAIPPCKKVSASTVPPGKRGTFLNLHFPFFEFCCAQCVQAACHILLPFFLSEFFCTKDMLHFE